MPATIHCPNPDCGATYSVVDEHVGRIGRIGRCKRCGSKFPLVPATAAGLGPAPGATSTFGQATDPGSAPKGEGLPLPESFGRYQIVRLLGRGGMGSVYLARDDQLKRQVALKVPHLGASADRPEVRVRFFREAEAAARFHHPNFRPIYDIGEFEGTPFLTMAFIEGEPLAAAVDRDNGWPPRRAARVARQLALALAELHRHGIVHRDLKPANVMVDARGGLVLMDFGLARWYDEVDATFTPTGAILGTPAYMSPEQAEGNLKAIGPRSDIYSLGVILYELLTGRRPFEGPITRVLGMIAYVEPAPPSTLRPDLPAALEAICLKAMAKKPEGRPSSMDELAAALQAWLESDRLARPAATPVEPARPAATMLIKPPREETLLLGPPPRRPHPSPWIAAVALTALASLTLAAYTLAPRGPIPGGGPAMADRDASARGFGGRRGPIPPDPTADRGEPPRKAEGRRGPPTAKPGGSWAPPANSIGMTFRPIPAGEFLMGSDDSREPDETPRHRVRISKPFELGTTEVTVGQFRKFVEDSHHRTVAERSAAGGQGWDEAKAALVQSPRYSWRWPGFDQTDDHPVVNVSWDDAARFCAWLGRKEGLKYRLPTEAEWEYACRAGAPTAYGFGNDPEGLAAYGNVADASAHARFPSNPAIRADDGHAFTAPVGRFRPNAWGLQDMHGNVWE